MKKYLSILVILILSLISISCSSNSDSSPLDPSKPVTVTVWHYYNGHIKDNFDSMVNEFNETVGMEKGLVVDAQSLGDVQKLADAVYDAANKTIGSQPMPDIFASYPDNAYRINRVAPLVTLETYFTDEELNSYYPAFLEEGRFPEDGKLRIVPVAKSSENLYLNKTEWEPFAAKNKLSEANLLTWEDLIQTAKLYYEQTGKSFFSIDANANFMLTAAEQLGTELYMYTSDGVKFNFSSPVAEKIWASFYVPYINSYYTKSGRFSSDDAKTGNILAYTGSTAGAAYFPREISSGQQSIPVESMTLPFPHFKGGKAVAIQQGAGLCITKSDNMHEYAAAVFLKWFTEPAQNVKFSVSTGYLPSKKESISEAVILPALDATELNNPTIYKTMVTTINMFDSYTFYNNKPFAGSYEMRVLLETHLWQQVEKDLEQLERRVVMGESRTSVIAELSSKENFEAWYHNFLTEAIRIIK